MQSEIGKKYYQLTVLKETKERTKAREKVFLVECSCGVKKKIALTHVRRGSIKSCGCLKTGHFKEFIKGNTGDNHVGFKGCGGMLGSIWCRIKASAKKRNLEFLITKQEAWGLFEKQEGICALSGEKILFAKNCKDLKAGKNTASLDRINSKIGYTKENIQWVHVEVNYMKQRYEQKRFLDWCSKIHKFKTKQNKSIIL